MSLMFKCNILLFVLLLSCACYGQIDPVYNNYVHYEVEDGLPQNYVSYLAQDGDGFIWLATLNGLARFDGHQFLQFNSNSPDPNRLSTSQILDLIIDDANNLWILNFNYKVDLMNPRTFEVQRDVQPFMRSDDLHFKFNMGPKAARFVYFVSDNAKKNWFVKNGTEYYHIDSTLTQVSDIFASEDSTEFGYGFDIDEKGRFWYMTDRGLAVAKTTKDSLTLIPIPADFNYEPGIRNKCPVVCLPDSKVLFAYENRMFMYHETTNRYQELSVPNVPVINNSKIFNLTTDLQQRPVFQYQGYIFRVEKDDRITVLWAYPEREKFVVTGLLVDRSNTLWVGINTGGLYKVNLLTPSFHSSEYKVNFVADILMGEIGVPAKELPASWKANQWAYDFRYFSTGKEQMYLKYDYYNYDGPRQLFKLNNKKLEPVETGENSIEYFVGLGESSDKRWALGKYGWMYSWVNDLSPPEQVRMKEINSLAEEVLSDMIVDNDFQWVISVNNTLYQVKDGEIIQRFSPASDNASLIDIVQDPDQSDILWIATLGDGLVKWDKSTKKTSYVYNAKDGLSDNSVGAVVPDSLGNLWMATFNGISRLNKKAGVITAYYKQDGLIESEFNRHHSFTLPDGRIALGGTIGYSVFDPNEFVEDDFEPELKITSLSINNQIQSYSKDHPILTAPLNELQKLQLGYQENSLLLEMAAMQFNGPKKNQYRYKLSGYNQDWVYNGTDRKIKFDKLRSGTYTLAMNASNTNGTWSTNVRELTIKVLPPPWLSWWAFTLYGLALSSLVYIYWRGYRKKIIKQQEEEFNRRENIRLKEVDDMKTRFFSNITHEFRTPLTLILSPLEKQLRDKNFPKEVQSILENNYRHGSHLLKLVNELLDISKLESGFMQSHPSTGRLDTFVKSCVDQFQEIAQTKNIELAAESKNLDGFYQFDKTHLETVLQNLLSNAIKFTEPHGQVHFAVEVGQGDQLRIEVRDTGIGIPEEQLPRLFDRFYQVDETSTRVHGGTGIGLSLVNELVSLMGGEVTVESVVGQGSCFTVYMPVIKMPLHDVEQHDISFTPAESGENVPLVLVVEDNDELRAFIVESLSENNVVVSARNGKEGWEILLDRLPDVVISDIMMPEMNGYELCRQSKQDLRTSHIYFILLTAKTAQESKVEGLEAGADGYIAKPFHLYELELRIQNAMIQQRNLISHYQQQLLATELPTAALSVGDAFIDKFYRFLDRSLHDTSLKVETVAREMAMSNSTLNRKVKSLLGITTNELIKRYRLQKAAELIRAGESIATVAFNVGFETHSYFSQSFKEVYQVTPTEYREQTNGAQD
ncbi:putative Signal transduction histidine kinase [Imperialibacter sp. 89]|nr:putative Signal transduction histidine kinase [Imperialibacter sp. 89]